MSNREEADDLFGRLGDLNDEISELSDRLSVLREERSEVRERWRELEESAQLDSSVEDGSYDFEADFDDAGEW